LSHKVREMLDEKKQQADSNGSGTPHTTGKMAGPKRPALLPNLAG
jgi:hypothetical protein